MEMILPRTAHLTRPDPLLGTPAQKPRAHPPSQQEWKSLEPLKPPLPAHLLTVGAPSHPPLNGPQLQLSNLQGVSKEWGW